MTSKEGTADFADFADKGDAAQRSRWRAKSLGRDSAIPAAILSSSFLSATSATSAVMSTAWKRLRVEARSLGPPTSACVCVVCGPALPATKLKAEVRRAEPNKDALRVTGQRTDRGFRGFRG